MRKTDEVDEGVNEWSTVRSKAKILGSVYSYLKSFDVRCCHGIWLTSLDVVTAASCGSGGSEMHAPLLFTIFQLLLVVLFRRISSSNETSAKPNLQPAAFYHPPSSSQREEAIGTPTSSTRSSPHEWIDGQAAGSNGVRAASQSITSATRSCFFLDRGVHNALVFSASVGRESVRFGRQVEL